MKSSGFVAKLIIGSIFISVFSYGIVNCAERMNAQYFGQIFHPQDLSRPYGIPTRSIPYRNPQGPHNPNINQPRRNN